MASLNEVMQEARGKAEVSNEKAKPVLTKEDIELNEKVSMHPVKKLFISQPMKGLTDEEIKAARAKAITMATIDIKARWGADTVVEAIDSFFEGAPHDAKPLWFLGESFKKLSEADVAYFIKGWDTARGCIMEHEAAERYLEDDEEFMIIEAE